MSKDKIKRTIVVGIEDNMSELDIAFLERRYNVKSVPFSELKKEDMYKLDLLFFLGGADVNPELYSEKKGKFTMINEKRDKECVNIFYKYSHVPKLGICRGSQFLTVMNGGKLVQHVEGHATGKNHTIDIHFDGNEMPSSFTITSTHHQMMYPFVLPNNKYELLAWSSISLSNTYLNGANKQIELPAKFVEPEIVYYPGTQSLAIQGHPEYDSCPNNTKDLCLDLITDYLL